MNHFPTLQLFSSNHRITAVEFHLSKLLGHNTQDYELQALVRQSQLIKTKPGEYICRESELTEGIFILLSGSAKSIKTNHKNHPATMHIDHSVNLINTGFLSGNNKHMLTMQAQTECTTLLLKIKKDDLNKYPALMRLLLDVLSASASDMEVIVQSLLTRPLPERVAQKLLMVAHPESQRIYATQSDLAEMLGVSRQKIHAEIKKLVENGCIKSGYGWFEIIDKERLNKITKRS